MTHRKNLNFIEDDAYRNILYDAKFFLIEKNVMKLLNPLYTNNKMGMRKMPFVRMMLLNTFELGSYTIRGMCITNTVWKSEISIKCYFFINIRRL